MSAQHTEGPWRFEIHPKTKTLQLVGGRPQFDLTILQPIRWGMSSASLFVRDTAHDGMNLLHKLHERQDWVRPFPGREHHASWLLGVKHPDLTLIEAAPDLLAALKRVVKEAEVEVFERWVNATCPSGDIDVVTARWRSTTEYAEFCDRWAKSIDAINKAEGLTS